MYNLVTINYKSNYKLEPALYTQAVNAELRHAGLKVHLVKADMVMRTSLTNTQGHNGKNGCDQCIGSGTQGNWLPNTINAPLRDETSWERDVPYGYTFLGRKGHAPLKDFEDFKITEQMPVDPMHSLFLGLTANMIDKFIVDGNCVKKENIQNILSEVNDLFVSCNVPKEVQRDCREIDSKWKSNEYKIFILGLGAQVANIYFKYGYEKLGQLFARFTFILRGLLLPNQWYEMFKVCNNVENMIEQHYISIHQLLGDKGCTPNLHAFTHIPHWREQYRLHEISCEPGERYYGENKRAYEERNYHTGYQLHYNRLMNQGGHFCRKRFSYSPPNSNVQRDNSILVDRQMKLVQ